AAVEARRPRDLPADLHGRSRLRRGHAPLLHPREPAPAAAPARAHAADEPRRLLPPPLRRRRDRPRPPRSPQARVLQRGGAGPRREELTDEGRLRHELLSPLPGRDLRDAGPPPRRRLLLLLEGAGVVLARAARRAPRRLRSRVPALVQPRPGP